MGGVVGLCAVMAALLDRDRTGEGHLIDLSQAEALGYFAGVTYLETLFAETEPGNESCGPLAHPSASLPSTTLRTGRAGARGSDKTNPKPAGNRSPSAAPHDCFPCRSRPGEDDRWCAIAVETDDQWKALCAAMGRADLASDPRLASLPLRQKHLAELNQAIAEWTSARDPYEVMHTLQAAGVPCGVVQTGADLLNDPHLRARQFLVELEHPVVGRLTYPGLPFRLTATPGKADQLAPVLGQHNDYVFRQLLGLSREEIAKLQAEKVLV